MLKIVIKLVTGGIGIRNFFLLLFSSIFIFSVSAEYPDYLTEAEKNWLDDHIGQVRLAPDPSFEPFEFFDSENEYKGLSADYIHLIEKKLGFKFTYKKISSWSENVEMMKRRELDLWGAVVKTPQRAEFMEFTRPYYNIHSILIIPSSYEGDYVCDPESDDKIAVIDGYYTHDYLLNKFPVEKIIPFSSPAGAFRSVQEGYTAAFLTDIATASYYFEKNDIKNLRVGGSPDLGSSSLSVAVRNDWKILAVIIDKVIARITYEEHAEIVRRWINIENPKKIPELLTFSNAGKIGLYLLIFVCFVLGFHIFYLRWKGLEIRYWKIKITSVLLVMSGAIVIVTLSLPLVNFRLTDKEREWLQNHPGLRIAPDYSFAPIEFIENGKFRGIASDYVREIEKRLNYKFKIVHIEKWSDNVNAAVNREIDIWSAVAPTPLKREYMLFTDSYLDILSVIIVSKGDDRKYDLNRMGNKVISVVDGYFTHDYLRNNFPDVRLNLVENASIGLRSVVFKDVDAMFIDVATAAWLIENEGFTTLKVAAEIDTNYHLSFASRSDMPMLNAILNRALNSIPQDVSDDIYQRWVSYSMQRYQSVKKLLVIFGFIFVLMGIIFLFIILWNRSLRRMVALRMQQISEKEAQLIQVQKMEMVGTLAGGLAHDFNNILAGITGTVSLIRLRLEKEGTIQPDQLEKYLLLLEKSGDRAGRLVHQLLTISRKEKPSKNIINLNDIVSSVVSIFQSTLDESVVLDVIYSEKVPLVYADAGQIEQILLNFCVNASHSMTVMRDSEDDWGGTITISVKGVSSVKKLSGFQNSDTKSMHWVVSVKDSGVGMDTETLSKIFTPFFTTKDSGNGTGLGLSMVFSIARQHNGFIEVESAPGKGSVFQLILPEVTKPGIDKKKN